ncbi:cytochrome b [Variovorax sp. KK3]|uniref:cytochrome b n=1 Tax=Variovorax sp. KK3 TaxID=1855728 RepID=UPI00097BDBA0|nr:cytochrome b [Variovorax sp. KK3]
MSAEPPRPEALAPPRVAARRYGAVAMTLHWLLALMIVTSFSVGLYMSGLPFSPLRLKLFNWHKWAGITILGLTALRLLWRLSHPPPPLPACIVAAMPGWQLVAHRGTHLLLYLLFFAVPLAGWAYSSALGFPIVWLGLVPLPDLVPVDKQLAEAVLKPLHQGSAFTLAAVASLHAAAALKHHWVDRDGLMDRMWPLSHQGHRR